MNYELRTTTLKKIQEYLLYLFIFLLPWQTRWIVRDAQISGGVFEYGRISIYSFDIIFLIILLSFLFEKNFYNQKSEIRNQEFKTQNPKLKIYRPVFWFLISVFLILNIIIASDKILTTYWWLRLMQGIILLWLLKKIDFSQTKAALSFIFSITISAVLGIYQFITQNVFASKWLGMASQNPGDLGVSVVETMGGRWLRAYGNLPHPNILAGFIVMAIILFFWLILKTQNSMKAPLSSCNLAGWLPQDNHKTQNKISKEQFLDSCPPERLCLAGFRGNDKKGNPLLLYYLITLLLVVGLFFTFSRAAWLVLVIYSFLFLFFGRHPERSDGILTKDSIDPPTPVGVPWNDGNKWFLVLCSGVFVFLCVIYWPFVDTRFSSFARLEIKSNTERLAGYNTAWQMIKQDPLTGVGLGNYTVTLQKLNPNQPAWFYQPVHNVYLLILAELGVIIPLITLLLYYFIVYSKKFTTKNRQEKLNLMFLCLGGLMFFDHLWWTLPSGLLILFLTLGKAWPKEKLTE